MSAIHEEQKKVRPKRRIRKKELNRRVYTGEDRLKRRTIPKPTRRPGKCNESTHGAHRINRTKAPPTRFKISTRRVQETIRAKVYMRFPDAAKPLNVKFF